MNFSEGEVRGEEKWVNEKAGEGEGFEYVKEGKRFGEKRELKRGGGFVDNRVGGGE